MALLIENPRTDVALEPVEVTNAVRFRQVSLHAALVDELPVTRVSRVGMIGFSRDVRRKVVSPDR